MATTPNMNVSLPSPGITTGPEWAETLNEAFETVDEHDHSPGKGLPVTPDGLNINGDLNFQDNFQDNVAGTRLTQQSTVLATANDVRMLYSVGGDLYYNNEDGTDIKITDGAGLNASTIGGIGGDYGASDATLNYSELTKTFVFNQDVDKRANVDVADVTIRDDATSANGITLKSPVALGSSYDMTLPTGLPVSTKFLTISSSGQIAATYDTDNSTLEVNASSLRVKDNGVTRTKMALTQKSVVGEVKMVWGAGSPVALQRGWMYLDGATVNQTNYDAHHGAGAFVADGVAAGGLNGVVLPAMGGAAGNVADIVFPAGSTNSANWTAIPLGATSNSRNIGHYHDMDHVHAWHHYDSGSIDDTYNESGNRSNYSGATATSLGILISSNVPGPGESKLGGQAASDYCYTTRARVVGVGGDNTSSPSNTLVRTQSIYFSESPVGTDINLNSLNIAPRSIRFGYIIRVAN